MVIAVNSAKPGICGSTNYFPLFNFIEIFACANGPRGMPDVAGAPVPVVLNALNR